jgi:hypothetical protein
MPQATLLEFANKTTNPIMQGLALSVVTTDALAALIPMKVEGGQAMVYLREGDPPNTEFIPDSGTMGTATSATTDRVTVPFRRIASDVDVDSLAADLSKGAEVGYQIGRKVKSTWQLITDTMVNGAWETSYVLSSVANPFNAVDGISVAPWMDSNRYGPGSLKYVHSTTSWSFRAPGDVDYGNAVVAAADGVFTLYSTNKSKYIQVTLDVSDATQDGEAHIRFASTTNQFDGMKKLVAPSMIQTANGTDGDDFSFVKLDNLIDALKVRDNRAFIMNGKLINKYLALHRALGGTTPDHLKLPGYSGEVMTYRGIPLLTCDHVLSNEAKGSSSTLSSIYLASLSSDEGLFLGVPDANASSGPGEGDPRRATVLGWRITDIGERETVAHKRTRVAWYGALGLRSALALAQASGIKTA